MKPFESDIWIDYKKRDDDHKYLREILKGIEHISQQIYDDSTEEINRKRAERCSKTGVK